MKDKKGTKINDTSETPSGDVLSSTLNAMEEFDMNKMNDVSGTHDFNGPSKLSGK